MILSRFPNYSHDLNEELVFILENAKIGSRCHENDITTNLSLCISGIEHIKILHRLPAGDHELRTLIYVIRLIRNSTSHMSLKQCKSYAVEDVFFELSTFLKLLKYLQNIFPDREELSRKSEKIKLELSSTISLNSNSRQHTNNIIDLIQNITNNPNFEFAKEEFLEIVMHISSRTTMTFSEVLQDAEKHLFTQVPTVSQDESIDTIFAIEAKKFKNEIFTSGPVGELEVTGKLNFFFKEHSVQISNFLRLVGSPALRQIAIDGRELQFIKVEDADFIAEVARTYEQGSAPSAEKTQRAFEIIVSFYQFEPYEAIDKAYYKAFEIDKCRKVIQYLSDNYGF